MNVQAIFDKDPRIVSIREYAGWVANAYRYPCPRKATEHYRDGTSKEITYDAKRPHGRGPRWVAMSEKGGRLASV